MDVEFLSVVSRVNEFDIGFSHSKVESNLNGLFNISVLIWIANTDHVNL